MTLSTVTAFSGITDKAPASPAYLNSKFSEVYDVLDAMNVGIPFGAVTSGSTTTFPVAQRFVLQSIDSGGAHVNVLAYGADPTGTLDCHDAIVSAISAANGRRHAVYFPGGTYRVDSTISLGSSIGKIMLVGAGRYASVISNNQAADLFTLNVGAGFGFEAIQLHMNGSTYTQAIGVHLIGNGAEFMFRNAEIYSIGSIGILFEANTGSGALITDSVFNPASVSTLNSGQSNVPAIGQRGFDTQATPRIVNACMGIGGTDLWNVDAPNDMYAQNCFFRNAVVTADSGNPNAIEYIGMRFATTGYPTYLRGNSAMMFGGTHAGNIIIDTPCASAQVLGSTVSGVVDNSGSTSLIYSGAYNRGGFWINPSQVRIVNDSSLTPGYTFNSELSLGLYRSGVSTIAPSYGTLNLASNAVRLSVRTIAAGASATSANVAANEMTFQFNASGASLAIRSGGTVWYFSSSLSTNG